jgi:hypothetical protein
MYANSKRQSAKNVCRNGVPSGTVQYSTDCTVTALSNSAVHLLDIFAYCGCRLFDKRQELDFICAQRSLRISYFKKLQMRRRDLVNRF